MFWPDEEGGCDQHNGEVHCHRSFEVERFKECCGVGDQEKEEGGEVGGQQLIREPPFEHDLHLDAGAGEAGVIVVQAPGLDVVLGQLRGGEHLYHIRLQLHSVPGKLLQLKIHPTYLHREFSVHFSEGYFQT